MLDDSMEQSELKTKIKKISDKYYYDQTCIIGKGTTSVVFKGYDVVNSRVIACKIIPNKTFIIYKLQKQVDIMKLIKDKPHQNIVNFYDFIQMTGEKCQILEYCEGGSLTAYLKNQQKVSEKNALNLIRQIICGIDHFNNKIDSNKEMMHRDIKPDNIYLTNELTIRIGDFGLASQKKNIEQTKIQSTPQYAAPQLDGKTTKYSSKCDVWSIGLIVHQILTGKKLYQNIIQKSDFLKNLKAGHKINLPQESYHPFWNQFLNSMLVENHENRKSISQIKEMLEINIENLQKNMSEKYGYCNTKSSVKLINSKMSPNIADQSKYYLKSIILAQKEEQSFRKLNKCRKYLLYHLQIGMFYHSIIRIFQGHDKTFPWNNVHKYMLMALSLMACVAKFRKILEQISERRILTLSFGQISLATIFEKHTEAFENILKNSETDFSHQSKKFTKILVLQIIPKIKDYMKKEQTATILKSQPNFVSYINDIELNHWKQESDYLECYRNMINKKPLFLQYHIISEYERKHVQQYYRMRLIAHTLSVFPQIYCNNQDYIMRKKQEIENSSKEEILLMIKQLIKG